MKSCVFEFVIGFILLNCNGIQAFPGKVEQRAGVYGVIPANQDTSTAEFCDTSLPSTDARGIAPTLRKWLKDDNGIVRVPFVFGQEFSDEAKQILSVANMLYKRYTCIELVEKNETDVDYINFLHAHVNCRSNVGRKGGEQEIYLTDGCAETMGLTIHQIGHALGVFHESSRPDRDDYVIINWDNIKTGSKGNFEKYSVIDSKGFPYDYNSVMHLASTAHSIGPTDYTIVKKDGTPIYSPTHGFSSVDVDQFNALYECNGVTGQSSFTMNCYRSEDNGLSYRGTMNTITHLGLVYECLPWSDYFNTDRYFVHNLTENHCRNPNIQTYSQPICYIWYNDDVHFGYCDIPNCPDDPTTTPGTTTTPETATTVEQTTTSEPTTPGPTTTPEKTTTVEPITTMKLSTEPEKTSNDKPTTMALELTTSIEEVLSTTISETTPEQTTAGSSAFMSRPITILNIVMALVLLALGL